MIEKHDITTMGALMYMAENEVDADAVFKQFQANEGKKEISLLDLPVKELSHIVVGSTQHWDEPWGLKDVKKLHLEDMLEIISQKDEAADKADAEGKPVKTGKKKN